MGTRCSGNERWQTARAVKGRKSQQNTNRGNWRPSDWAEESTPRSRDQKNSAKAVGNTTARAAQHYTSRARKLEEGKPRSGTPSGNRPRGIERMYREGNTITSKRSPTPRRMLGQHQIRFDRRRDKNGVGNEGFPRIHGRTPQQKVSF